MFPDDPQRKYHLFSLSALRLTLRHVAPLVRVEIQISQTYPHSIHYYPSRQQTANAVVSHVRSVHAGVFQTGSQWFSDSRGWEPDPPDDDHGVLGYLNVI